jgi:hypothetical protein
MKVSINVSVGELFDKISILQIKTRKIKDENKLSLVKTELDLLLTEKEKLSEIPDDLFNLLKIVNEKLWLIEDRIRIKESRQEFDQEFIDLARDVYYTNDQRCAIKHQIDVFFGSEIQEVKDYVDYSKNIKKEA